jgi:NAD(P)-dependent dehydrogenase (short-subunit alcohol dehydrogenase family)
MEKAMSLAERRALVIGSTGGIGLAVACARQDANVMRLGGAGGPLPREMSEALARHKDISYASRTRRNTDTSARAHNLKTKLLDALLHRDDPT